MIDIRDELQKRNLKIADLVRGLELDRTTIEKWLRGVTPMKKMHELAIERWLQLADEKK